MLFNSIDQIKEITGFFYAYNNFENIKTDIELSEESIVNIIGQSVFDIAQAHFDDPPEIENPLLDALVKHIQLPVAYHAIHSYSQNTDISHEDSGRKVKIDSEREKLPWEWMLEKDERAILKKAYKTTDRLIAFLEKNVEETDLLAWKESPNRLAIKGQLIADAETFDEIYPIDKSRRFFITISPFIREAERKYILPALTQSLFYDIKTHLQAGTDDSIEPAGILPFIRVPLAYLAMGIAVERLNVQLLPEGVFQNMVSERLTQNAKVPVNQSAKREFSVLLQKQGMAELKYLQEFITKSTQGENYTGADPVQGINEDNQFARV